MSTPTTATATLPHVHYNPHHYPYSHHQHQPYSQPNTASYRPPNQILPTSTRLPFPSPTSYTTSTSSHPASNGISLVASSTIARPLPQDTANLPIRVDNNYTTTTASKSATMAAVVAQAQALPDPQQSRKRRRSREPDWKSFYKNGLPKEIIVIDDTPEPETPASAGPSSLTNGHNGHTNGTVTGTAIGSSTRHVAKKRRRNDENHHYDPIYHNNIVGSHTTTPRRLASPSKSTVSSDRTNSAIHTTAATSLGSLSSSNGQYEFDGAQPGQKRKRTRQQIALEAKRREPEAYASYRPPPNPPKKAGDVHVKVIADVSVFLFPPSCFILPISLTVIHSTHTTKTSALTMTTAITSSSPTMTSPIDVSNTFAIEP